METKVEYAPQFLDLKDFGPGEGFWFKVPIALLVLSEMHAMPR
jgi:hypothetical protein